MKLVHAEYVGQYGLQAALHETLTVVRYERVVAEVAGAEVAPHDLADVDDGGKVVVRGTHPVADARRLLEALQVPIECLNRSRGRSPVAVQRSTSAHGGQELVSAAAGWLFEKGACWHDPLSAR
jgi:hypothetical protein